MQAGPIEPRNHGVRGADTVEMSGRPYRQQRYRKLLVDARDRAARGDGRPETFDFLGHADLRVMLTSRSIPRSGVVNGLMGSA